MSFKKLTDEEIKKLSSEELEKYNAELEAFEKTPIGISQNDYDALKSKHRGLKCLLVEDFDGKLRAGYFRRPNIPEIKCAKKNSENDEFDAIFTLYESTKLWVDPIVENDDFLKLSMIGKMGELMKLQNSYVKNY